MDETSEERVAKALREENTGSVWARIRNLKARCLDAEIEWAFAETPHCSRSLLCRLQPGHLGMCRLVGPTKE